MDISPLPYHLALRDYLKAHERHAWERCALPEVRAEQAEALRFELLKSTYRIDKKSWPEWYAAAESAAAKLGLSVPVTLYQSHHPQGINASLAALPDEAHIVLHGPVATKLSEAEFRALLGHELSHLLLWREHPDLLATWHVLGALAQSGDDSSAYQASASLFALYTEIFCDRGATTVAGSAATVIAMLIKITAGGEGANLASYLAQAERMFGDKSLENTDSGALAARSHPATYLRAWALKRWADGDPDIDAKASRAIEGLPTLDGLDLLSRQKMARQTRRLIRALVGPSWFQTPAVLSHARLYFEDFSPAPRAAQHYEDITLADDLRTADPALRDYYCFVLLDFVTADRDLKRYPLAAALQLAERLGFKEHFLKLALDELRLKKKQLEKIDEDKAILLADALSKGSSATP